MLCPSCGQVRPLHIHGSWTCVCGLARPPVSWTFTDDEVCGPGGGFPRHLSLPGDMNRANAAVALAVAAARGVALPGAVTAVERVDTIAGRYRWVEVDGRHVRLLLAKNPASWTETLELLEENDAPIVICVNARGPDGLDTSWLWDVAFERLAGRTVAATGERRLDLALRLQTAGVRCSVRADGPTAVRSIAPVGGTVELVGTYTAFHDVLKNIELRW